MSSIGEHNGEGGCIQKNVAYVVKTAMNRLGAPISDMSRLEQIGIEWMTEDIRGTTAFPCLKVAHIPLTGAKQAKMPADMLRYTKIAINVGGKLWTLTLCDDIALPVNMVCPEPSILNSTSAFLSNGIYFMPYWWDGSYYGGVFSMGGGFNSAYYRYDEASRTLSLLGGLPGNEIVVEYLSNGNDVNTYTLVPHYWIAPMRNYLIWQATLFMPEKYKYNPSNMERIYLDSLSDATFASGSTIDEIMDAYYSAPGLKLR